MGGHSGLRAATRLAVLLALAACSGGGERSSAEHVFEIGEPLGDAGPEGSTLRKVDPRTLLISAFKGRIRSTWLLVVEPDGRIRRIGMPHIRGGVDARRPLGAHYVGPSLALDSRLGIAVVVGPRAPVAELDLRTLKVRYHHVRGLDVSKAEIARDRPREWTGTNNPHSSSSRDAVVHEPGLVNVLIRESRLLPGWHVRELGRSVVLETRQWRVRAPRRFETGVRAGDVWLVNTRPPDQRRFPPFRLEAHERSGSVRYRLDGRPSRLLTWQTGAGLLYAGRIDGSKTHVFDVKTGKFLRTIPPRDIDYQLEPPVFRWSPPKR